MTTYLTISLLLSSICGLVILLLRGAPARLRFYICLMILVTWLTPWQLLQFQAESNTFILPLNILSEFNLAHLITAPQDTLSVIPVAEQVPTRSLTFYQLWLGVFSIGLILFFKDVVSYIKLHRRWIKHSKLDNQTWQIAQIPQPNCDIRRINTQAPGMTTGLTKPIIWLDSEQHEAEKIRTIVLHELTHIRQHDPYWLWVINLVQRLFWWNPLIWFTANYARQQIELSCDEQCKKHLPEGSYQLQLIKLTLQVNKQHHALKMPTVLQMSGTPAFNLQRINKLNEEHKMKKRYVVVMASLLSLTGWIGFSNATVNIEQPVSQENNTPSLVDVYNALNSEDYTKARTQLAKLTNEIDSFYPTEQAEIWRLNAVVLFAEDIQQSQILSYLDKAIALEDVLAIDKLLPIIDFAQSIAAAQKRWDKQISYANKWFTLADDNLDKKQILYLTSISHYQLKQSATSIKLLNELVDINETDGLPPEEIWLAMLFGNHIEGKNFTEAVSVQEKMTMLYPSEENQKHLENISQLENVTQLVEAPETL